MAAWVATRCGMCWIGHVGRLRLRYRKPYCAALSLRPCVRPSIRVISACPGTPAEPPAARGVRSRCGPCEQDCP